MAITNKLYDLVSLSNSLQDCRENKDSTSRHASLSFYSTLYYSVSYSVTYINPCQPSEYLRRKYTLNIFVVVWHRQDSLFHSSHSSPLGVIRASYALFSLVIGIGIMAVYLVVTVMLRTLSLWQPYTIIGRCSRKKLLCHRRYRVSCVSVCLFM